MRSIFSLLVFASCLTSSSSLLRAIHSIEHSAALALAGVVRSELKAVTTQGRFPLRGSAAHIALWLSSEGAIICRDNGFFDGNVAAT